MKQGHSTGLTSLVKCAPTSSKMNCGIVTLSGGGMKGGPRERNSDIESSRGCDRLCGAEMFEDDGACNEVAPYLYRIASR